MKIRFSKTMAAVLAACVGTFSGISAMADVSVYTTTGYDYANKTNADATVNVTSVVKDSDTANAGKMVTYLVSTGSGEEINIKFIDQATLDANASATFNFTAKQADIFGGTVTAKYGSNAGYTMPTFTFKEGTNYLSQGTASVSNIADTSSVTGTESGDKVVLATVSGNYTEYGVRISNGTDTKDCAAYGAIPDTEAGNATFAVVISNFPSGWTAEPYVK